MSQTILITGGMGYVGCRVSKYLAENTDYRLRISSRKKDLSRPEWLRNGEIIHADLLSDSDLKRASNGVKFIVHLAALNEIESYQNPELALKINGIGSLNLLRAAEENDIKRFIYFSTAHVYGSPLQGIITEKTLPRPIHPYAITHKTAEDFILAAHDQKILTAIVLRLSNGFGKPMRADINRWTLLVNDLCRQAVTKKRLHLRSSGFQKRDFVSLTDISRAVSFFLNLPNEKCDDGLFNLGGECSLRIIDMAELVADRCFKLFGFKPEISRAVNTAENIPSTLDYQVKKLKSAGFELVKNIDAEIDDTLLFCKNEFC